MIWDRPTRIVVLMVLIVWVPLYLYSLEPTATLRSSS